MNASRKYVIHIFLIMNYSSHIISFFDTHLKQFTGANQVIDRIKIGFVDGRTGVSSYQDRRRILDDHHKQQECLELLGRGRIPLGGSRCFRFLTGHQRLRLILIFLRHALCMCFCKTIVVTILFCVAFSGAVVVGRKILLENVLRSTWSIVLQYCLMLKMTLRGPNRHP